MYSKFRFLMACVFAGMLAVGSSGAQDALKQLKTLESATKEVVKKVSPATVALASVTGDMGSGVVVSKDGLILTAAHVVEGQEKVSVIFPDGKVALAKVLGANYSRDAAMAKLEGEGPWPHVELGDSAHLKAGNFVVALGHAKGFDPARRAPVRLGRLHTDGRQRFMISECTLIGGDSGGPLFDTKGKLVGIHSSIGPLLRINNHVPIAVFKDNWDKLLKGDQWGVLGVHPMADPEMAFLGSSLSDTEIAVIDGVAVIGILPGSPADKAGLQEGDVIMKFDDRSIRKMGDFLREISRFKPGEKVDLVVYRKGQTYKTTVTLDKLGDYMKNFNH